MDPHRKKILLAIDGSARSYEAVRYISNLFPPQRIQVSLFHVFSRIPEVYYDMGKEPNSSREALHVKAWERALKESIDKFMAEARQLLLDGGIPEDQILLHIQERKLGIARDIFMESVHGYGAVVVGRTGMSNYKEFIIGSIANKLVEKITHTTVCVVGERPSYGKILVALDESEGAMRAVDYVGTMFGGSPAEVTLFHVVRGLNIYERRYEDAFDPKYEREWIDAYEIESVFEEAKMHLVEPGFDPARVTTKLISGASSRAGAIIKEATEGGYGTIVLGRRGFSNVKEFFMGRVSDKVIHLARGPAVWVVS